MDRQRRHEAAETSQAAMYHTEHWLAWIAAAVAIAMGVIGVLWGFGFIEENVEALPGVEEGTVTAGAPLEQFWDGVLWLLPAITIAMLAVALHRTEHHRVHGIEGVDRPNMALMGFEHLLAWAAVVVGVSLAAVGLLVGFDVFDRGNTQFDGILWHLAGLGASVLAVGLHGVRHHATIAEEDMIIRIVEERVGMAPGAAPRGTTSRPGERVPEFRSR